MQIKRSRYFSQIKIYIHILLMWNIWNVCLLTFLSNKILVLKYRYLRNTKIWLSSWEDNSVEVTPPIDSAKLKAPQYMSAAVDHKPIFTCIYTQKNKIKKQLGVYVWRSSIAQRHIHVPPESHPKHLKTQKTKTPELFVPYVRTITKTWGKHRSVV